MTSPISNTESVIDSRDVIERIEDLESDLENYKEEIINEKDANNVIALDEEIADIKKELAPLKRLADEGEDYADDWVHGETLIHENYFTDYAKELAEDCGSVNNNAAWPNNHIDWQAAADELKIGYTEIDFDGETYYIR